MPHPKTVTTPEPSLGLILHAHLPAVPTGEFDAPEAVWFYQVLAESYIPVLERLARLARDPKHLDSQVDVAGYAACLREVTREV